MQKVHVRNLFRVFVPLVCPVGHQVDRLSPNPSNKCFGFSLKDTATGQVHLYQLQLYCLADREYAERTYDDWATWGKRHPLSFQKNSHTDEIEGVIIRIKVSHGVFDFRKMKEQLVRISAVYCVDGAQKNQGVSALFKILPKRRHGNDLESEGDEVKLTIDWDPLPIEPKPDTVESRMDTTSNIANTSHDYYTSPSIESYANSTSYVGPSNNNVAISNLTNSPQQSILSGHFSDYELLMFPNLPPMQHHHYSPYGDMQQQHMANEQYMVLYNGNAEVVGNFRALNFYKSSDINIKEDIRLLTENHDCRDVLLKIDGVDYKFKKGVHPDTNRRFIGFIAQQVESVVPEAVQLIDGVLHVDYEALLPYLSESVRANYNDIQDIKNDKTQFHQTFDTIYEDFIEKDKKKAKKEPTQPEENESVESDPGFSKKWKALILVAGVLIVGVGLMISTYAIYSDHKPHNPMSPLTPAHSGPTEPQNPLIERILNDLYQSMNGANWRHNIGWRDKNVPICLWYGVSCVDKSVTKLSLHRNGLSGTVPSSLFDLATLIEIDLSENDISGTLSTSITALTQLQVLQLNENSLTGTIPEELASMTSLHTLRLDGNRFHGTIPAGILSAPQLYEVTLANNTLSGTIPFVNVKHLDLSSNSLTGPLPQFGAITTNLNLANNKLEGDVTNLSNLTGIVSLLIGSNDLTGTLSFSETQLRTIKVLSMTYTSIYSIEQTEVVPNRPSLKSCDMSHVPLKCPLPQWAILNCNATYTFSSTIDLPYGSALLRYVRVEKVKSPGSKDCRNEKIIDAAQPLPPNLQLPALACYWFVSTEKFEVWWSDEDRRVFSDVEIATVQNGLKNVAYYLHRVDFKAKARGLLEFNFKNGAKIRVTCLPAVDILMNKLNLAAPVEEHSNIADVLRKLPPRDSDVENLLLLVPDKTEYIKLAEAALLGVGFQKEVSSPNRHRLYSQTNLINSKQHVLLMPFGDDKEFRKVKDYAVFASEAILLHENLNQEKEIMAIRQIKKVKTPVNVDGPWNFIVKTANFDLLDLDYESLTTQSKTLFSINELRGILGGASCQNPLVDQAFVQFINEWTLNTSNTVQKHVPQAIYLCFKFEPDIVQAFTEYSAIILAALDIEYVYSPVVVHGSVLVYIRCPSYLPWYILERKQDLLDTFTKYKLTEIYECFPGDIEASIKRPGNEEFVDELNFIKELMIGDDVDELQKPQRSLFYLCNDAMFGAVQMPPTIERLSVTQKTRLQTKFTVLKAFDNKWTKTLEECYNYDKLRQQLFNFTTTNAKFAVRVFVSSASAGLATNVAKLMRHLNGESIVDGVHAGLQIANTIVEWNQSGLVHIGELKHTSATAVLFDVQDSVKFDFNDEIASKMINFIQRWNVEHHYSSTEYNSHHFVRDFLQETLNVSLVERFKGPLGSYMDYVMNTGDSTPRLISKSQGTLVFKTHQELEDAEKQIRSKLSDDEIKLLKIFHRGFQLQEAAHGKDVSSCCYGLPTNGLEILNDSGKPMKY